MAKTTNFIGFHTGGGGLGNTGGYFNASGLSHAFTLAEVLITLGIIGLVAAMTLPSLISNYQHKVLESQFNKAYSELSQVILKIHTDNGLELIPNNFSNKYKLSDCLKEYYHIIKDCGNVNINTKGCIKLSPTEDDIWNMEIYKSYNGKSINFGYLDDGVLITNNGTTILFEQGAQAASMGRFLIGVDINGFTQKPNRFGHDVFVFEISPSGKLIPLGNPDAKWWGTGVCDAVSNSSINGYSCTYKAINEPDYFKNLPK